MTNPTLATILLTSWELPAVMESEVHNNIYWQQATYIFKTQEISWYWSFIELFTCTSIQTILSATWFYFSRVQTMKGTWMSWSPKHSKPRELHVGDVCRAARGGAAAGVGGRGGGLPAAADHSHSRGLPQTEENIPGQWSHVIIGAQRHQCMEGLENWLLCKQQQQPANIHIVHQKCCQQFLSYYYTITLSLHSKSGFKRPGRSARLLIAKLHNNWEIRQKQKQSSIAVSCRERTFPFLTTYKESIENV